MTAPNRIGALLFTILVMLNGASIGSAAVPEATVHLPEQQRPIGYFRSHINPNGQHNLDRVVPPMPVQLTSTSRDTPLYGTVSGLRLHKITHELTRMFRTIGKPKTGHHQSTGTEAKLATRDARQDPKSAALPASEMDTTEEQRPPAIRPTLVTETASGMDSSGLSRLQISNELPVHLAFAALALLLSVLAALMAFRWKIDALVMRRRIDAAQAIYEVTVRLTPDPEALEDTIREVLTRLQRVFAFNRISLVDFDPGSLSIKQVRGTQSEDAIHSELLHDAVNALRNTQGQGTYVTLWLQRGQFIARRASAYLLPSRRREVVASAGWIGTRLGAVIVAEWRSGWRANFIDDDVLGATTKLLAITLQRRERSGKANEAATNASDRSGLSSADEMAGGIAHEFNNLLTAIMGYAEMAADTLKPGSSSYAYVEHIQGASQRAQQVVDQVLACCRPSREALAPFDVGAAICAILPDLQMCIVPAVTVQVTVPEKILRVNGNAILLQQILLNLCKNAGEAMVGRGEVTVTLTEIELVSERKLSHGRLKAGRYVRVAVSDTGPGIAPKNLRNIFDPFFTTKKDRGGTGLGLSFVIRTVKSLDGALDLRSVLGAGTRFDLFFPHASPHESQLQSRRPVYRLERPLHASTEAAVDSRRSIQSTVQGEQAPQL